MRSRKRIGRLARSIKKISSHASTILFSNEERDRSIARYSSDYERILGLGIFKWEKREIGTKDRK